MEMKRPVPDTLQKAGTSNLQKVQFHRVTLWKKRKFKKRRNLKSVLNKWQKVLLGFFFFYISDLPKYFDLI